ncbi:MAG: SH3 domain-containing protein [Anaerolineae bacterium]|nr:SH3 domain-containing protein [Anaerolineae bacterium]
MRLLRKLGLLLVVACCTTVLAQDNTSTCSATIQQAMGVVRDSCAVTGRNQACYGYVSLTATPRANVENFDFSHEGDIANVADIENMQLSAFNAADNTWGVAMMKLQANLPDTLPGQNVTFVIFGDTQVQNGVVPIAETLAVTARSNINLRSGPAVTYRVVDSLAAGGAATAIGRSQDGQWLRIELPDNGTQGWVAASSVTADGDISQLTVFDATTASIAYQPMQAFYFRTGIGETGCEEAPQNGILIQTPSGVGKINLRANDVDIQLGSTVFLQSQGGVLIVSVLEGQAEVTAGGKAVIVMAGMQTRVLIDEDLHAVGRPIAPYPYNLALMLLLPIQLLPEEITVTDPLTQTDLSPVTVPTFTAPGSGVDLIMGDVALLVNVPLSEFCPLVDRALGLALMTRENYVELLEQSAQASTGTEREQFNQVLDKLNQCP